MQWAYFVIGNNADIENWSQSLTTVPKICFFSLEEEIEALIFPGLISGFKSLPFYLFDSERCIIEKKLSSRRNEDSLFNQWW